MTRMRHSPADANRVVVVSLIALIALELVSVGLLMQDPLREYRDARRAAMINETTDHLVRASLDLAFERGRTRVVLNRPDPIHAADAEFIAQRRQRGDASLAAALAELPYSQAMREPLAALRESHANVVRMRAENDSAAAQRLGDRPPQIGDRWFKAASRTLSDIEEVMKAAALDPAISETRLHDLLAIKIELLEIREAGGAESSHLAAAITRGTALQPRDRDRILASRLRAGEAWEELQDRVAAADAPSLTAALEAVRTEYVEEFGALRRRVFQSGVTGAPYPVSVDQYTARSIPALDSIGKLLSATAALANERTRSGLQRARTVITFNTLLALAAIGLVVWLVHFVYRNFRVPLERLNRTLAGGEIALWDADVASGAVHLSKEWSIMLGHPSREIDTTVSALKKWIHPDDRKHVLRVARKAIMEKVQSYRVEYRVRDAAGRWMWIRSEGRVVEIDSRGRAKRIAGVNMRIDERKRAEEALRAERERYRKLIEQMPDAIFINRGETIRYANPAALQLLGAAAPGEVVGSSIFRFLHPDDHAEARANIAARSVRGGASDFFERRYVRLDGTVIDLEMSGVEIIDEHGIARLIVARNVSERKRMERERRDTRMFLDSLVENIPHMIFVKDAQTLNYVRLNRAAEDLLGIDRADLLGKGDYDFFPREQADFFTDRDRVTLSSDQVVDIPEEPVQTGRRGLRYLHTKKIPIFDAADRPRFLLGISEDITERKQASEALRRANDALSERANELAAANRQLESFSSSVSHNLRAPLRHISSFATLLEQRCRDHLDANARRYLKQIGDAVGRMASLIDGLLEFARSGQGELARSDVDLDTLVREVAREMGMQAPPRRIDWEIGALPTVSGDPGLLRVVFSNLIENAVKYTGKREDAKIEIASVEGNGSEHVVYVRDNGVGFNPAYTDKLFAVFQRLHSERDFAGTGIGLASVQQIVRRHGGRVWAESRVDHGATFFLALPATASASASA